MDNEQATSWKRKSPKLINSQAEPAPESGVLFFCVATLALKQELIKICLENFLGFSLNFYLGEPKNPITSDKTLVPNCSLGISTHLSQLLYPNVKLVKQPHRALMLFS